MTATPPRVLRKRSNTIAADCSDDEGWAPSPSPSKRRSTLLTTSAPASPVLLHSLSAAPSRTSPADALPTPPCTPTTTRSKDVVAEAGLTPPASSHNLFLRLKEHAPSKNNNNSTSSSRNDSENNENENDENNDTSSANANVNANISSSGTGMTRARRSTTITAKQLKPKTLTAAQEKSNGSAVSSSSSSCSSSSSASTPTSSSSASPSTSSPKSQYQDAKTLLKRTTVPRRLVGRTAEREKIRQFCEDHILKAQPGSMYISGQPGTGKTALLKETLKDLEPQMMTMKEVRKQDVKIVLVNCMTVKEPRQIYQRLLNELSPAAAAAGGKDAVKALEAVLLKTNKNKIMHVVVLDELDNLASKDQEVLYKLFEWSSMEGSKLTLLSISNSLDLVDRLLPRLKARGCEPDLVNFAPYKVEEIREIVVGRLASLGCGDLMERQAIEFCARKVAGATGDLRTVLDICRRAFEIMEAEGKPVKAPLGEAKKGNAGAVLTAANTNAPAGATTMTPKVKVSHIQKALAAAFGSPMVQRMRALGVHHKVVLEVLAKKAQQGPKADECEVGRMFEEYTASCRGRKVAPVSRGEFQDVVGTLEGSGLITMSKAKEVGRRRMGLVVSEKEVLEAVVQKQDQ